MARTRVLWAGVLAALALYVFNSKVSHVYQSEQLNHVLRQAGPVESESASGPSTGEKSPAFHYNPANVGLQKLLGNSYFEEIYPQRDRTQIGAENATLVMLVRNKELQGALSSMRSLEDRFNRDYKYPWVFMNDVPFDPDFIEQTTLMASGKTFYELIPKEDWDPPSHIDAWKFEQNLKNSWDIIYGPVRSYRNMCHFNSGYFYRQKRLLNYEWYFRVEPDVEYMCDFGYDPFTLMRKLDKKYGFVITIPEYQETVPTLWETVVDFMDKYPQYVHPNNSLDFMRTNESDVFFNTVTVSKNEYNGCHFWLNFEIANLDFFRGEAYGAFFDHLDKAGGFYYERWGDAPVHLIGVSMLLDRDAVHHFEDIGYYHAPYMSCPQPSDIFKAKRCICRHQDQDGMKVGMDVLSPSCLARWWRYGLGKRFLNQHPLNL